MRMDRHWSWRAPASQRRRDLSGRPPRSRGAIQELGYSNLCDHILQFNGPRCQLVVRERSVVAVLGSGVMHLGKVRNRSWSRRETPASPNVLAFGDKGDAPLRGGSTRITSNSATGPAAPPHPSSRPRPGRLPHRSFG